MGYPKDLMSEVLFTEKQIREAAKRLAKQIDKDYKKKNLTVVCTLKGATFFFTDLMKFVKSDCEMEFIKASSYIGNTTITIGNVTLQSVMSFPIRGRDILIVEDIVDTGLTAEKLFKYFKENGCASVEMCTMLDKPSRRVTDIKPKYVGYEVEDKFVIGYGLDYDQLYRNINCVGVINPKYIKGN